MQPVAEDDVLAVRETGGGADHHPFAPGRLSQLGHMGIIVIIQYLGRMAQGARIQNGADQTEQSLQARGLRLVDLICRHPRVLVALEQPSA